MTDQKTIAQQTAVEPAMRIPPVVPESVHYPDSDGHFLPAHPLQARAVLNSRFALQQHFDRVDNVVLEGNMYLYYEEGNPAASISPDVFVVLEHDLGDRPVYKLWEEGKPPDFALEVISPTSEIRNGEERRELYARLGIGEYFLFQPDPRRRGRRLVGYRLTGASYDEVKGESGGALHSSALGVSLRVEGKNLRLRSLASGKDYAWFEECRKIIDAQAEEHRRILDAQAEEHRRILEARAEEHRRFLDARAEEHRQTFAQVEKLRQAKARVAELEALLEQNKRQDH